MLSYTPFGRGKSSMSKAVIQTAYGYFRDLMQEPIGSGGLGFSDENIADSAGIPELWFNMLFDYDTGHRHLDGSLSPGVVGHTQLDSFSGLGTWPDGTENQVKRVEFIESQSPGTVAIFGVTGVLSVYETSGLRKVWIPFGQGSPKQSVFRAGTVPVVITSALEVYNSTFASGKLFRIIVEEVDSTGFGVRFERVGDISAYGLCIYYLAIGTAPGYLYPLGGVA